MPRAVTAPFRKSLRRNGASGTTFFIHKIKHYVITTKRSKWRELHQKPNRSRDGFQESAGITCIGGLLRCLSREILDFHNLSTHQSLGDFDMGKSEAQYFEMNRVGWDRRTAVHVESKFYDVEGFMAGALSLREIELAELQDVVGKRMLHLQCHFGLDTLSWARKGAICTGVDISPVAIKKAQELAERCNLSTQFLCSDVYGFAAPSKETFDIVFTSYGALCWLPDLSRWAEIVASNLAPGGRVYIVEFHPINDLLAGFSYFTQADPDIEKEGTYTENGGNAVAELATWTHPISSVINALLSAGIKIERISEFPYSPYNCFEGMVEREPGRFYLSHKGNDVPIIYSISGQKTL